MVNLDKLTYAKNLESLVAGRPALVRIVALHRLPLYLDAESHVDRSIEGTGFIHAYVVGTYTLQEA